MLNQYGSSLPTVNPAMMPNALSNFIGTGLGGSGLNCMQPMGMANFGAIPSGYMLLENIGQLGVNGLHLNN